MIPRRLQKFTLIGTAILTCLLPYQPASSSVFEQQELDQSQVIAIARPYGNQKYDLLILLQIAGGKQCWSESGANPTLIDPLLLNFDFTGSCERSTDSNGYSIRVDGQDYGLDYLLRIVERNGELVLVGTNRLNPGQPEMIVGRTYGIGSGFLKIALNPGWRFTKRSFQEKALSHVYLTGDSQAIKPPQELVASDPSPQTRETPSVTPPKTTEETRELTFTAPETQSTETPLETASTSLPEPISTPETQSPPPVTETPLETASTSLPEPTSTPETQSPPPVTETPLETASTSLPEPTSTPSPDLSKPVVPPPLTLPSSDTNTQTVPPPPTTNNTGRKTLSDVLVLNSEQRPPTNSPPSNPSNFRVMVDAKDSTEKTKVRSLYPDAFPTAYNGRSLWQIGVFSSRQNAEVALKSLSDLGIDGVIVPF